jgi:hypothetical protein
MSGGNAISVKLAGAKARLQLIPLKASDVSDGVVGLV